MSVKENVPENRELAGKRALVTGGTRGIGAAIVRRLLEAGAEVITTARSATGPAPEGAGFVQADVRTLAGAEALAGAALEALGGVDILVHNAGGARPHKDGLVIPDEEWLDTLNLNLLASVRLNSLLVPGMRERRSGAIVHISSAAVAPPAPPSCTTRRRRRRWTTTAPDWPRRWPPPASGSTPSAPAGPPPRRGGDPGALGEPRRRSGPERHRPAGTRRPARRHRPRGAVPRVRPGGLGDRDQPRRGRRGIPQGLTLQG